jgi:hypothetical protein
VAGPWPVSHMNLFGKDNCLKARIGCHNLEFAQDGN